MSAFRKFVASSKPPNAQGPIAQPGSGDLPPPAFGEERLWGIENFSNSCYCNSILQALYACTTFREFVEAYPDVLPPSRPLGPSQPNKLYPTHDWDAAVPGWDASVRLNTQHKAFAATQEVATPMSPGGKEKRNWMGKKQSTVGQATPTLASLQINAPSPLPHPYPEYSDPLLSGRPPAEYAPTIFQTLQTLFYHFSHSPPHMPIKEKGQTREANSALVSYTEEKKREGVNGSEDPETPGSPPPPPQPQPAEPQSPGPNGANPPVPQGPTKLASMPPPSTLRESGPWRAGQVGWGVVQPYDVIDAIKRSSVDFNNDDQHDAHEFFNLVVNNLKDSMTAVDAILEREGKGVVDMSKNPWAQNFVQVLFEALGDKQVKCLSCESTKANEEIYLDLGIPIEQHSSVSHSLRQFTDTEHLCGTNKFLCDNCGGHQEAEMGIKIRRLPPILALHLQRFENIDWTMHTQKLFYRVQCPDTLRVPTAATDDNPNPDQLYELVAIVVHIGITPTQGHYVTLKRIPSGLWVMCDDDNIEPVPASDLFHWLGDRAQGQNYVLFYQAVDVSAQDLGLKVEKRKPDGVFKPVGEGVKILDRKGDDEWRFGSLGSAAGALVQERDEESVVGSVPSPGPAFASIPPSAPPPKADGVDRQLGFNTVPVASPTPLTSLAPTPSSLESSSAGRPLMKKEPSEGGKKWYRNRMSMTGKDKDKGLNGTGRPGTGGSMVSSRPSTAQSATSAYPLPNGDSGSHGGVAIQSPPTATSPNQMSSSVMSSFSGLSTSTGTSSGPAQSLPSNPIQHPTPLPPSTTASSPPSHAPTPKPVPSSTPSIAPSQVSAMSSLGHKTAPSVPKAPQPRATSGASSNAGNPANGGSGSLSRRLSGMGGKLGRSGSMAFGKMLGKKEKDGIQEK
ncbi:hypothetical protein B9479_001500 [Cryptococcus floricola]|uniref:ubiquitinyl hydrolase 1 n=1 Tax=Cryptococcus floricola TaxID=2591691 RepID=A0A5D3B6Q8_9TREE|nr:hypothetical protein B9479_001500 [Cryptococcus floricola]